MSHPLALPIRSAPRVFSLAFLLGVLGPVSLAQAAGAVAYVTHERAGLQVIDLDTLTVHPDIDLVGKEPRGVAVSADGSFVITANKGTGDISIVDTATRAVTRRIPIGKNPEFVRIRDGLAYVSYEPGPGTAPVKLEAGGKADPKDKPASSEAAPVKPTEAAGDGGHAAVGGEGKRSGEGKGASKPDGDDDKADDPPAHLAIVDLKTFAVVGSITSGKETEGIEFSPDGRHILVTNEGDDTVSVYDRKNGAPVVSLKTTTYGKRPRGIKVMPDGKGYVVSLEFSDRLLLIDDQYKVVRTVDTKKAPYGLAFDPSGKRLLVAAARDGVLQVFDTATYTPVAEISVGKRCWHFTFTPDTHQILAACGRSNNVYVIDDGDYHTVKIIEQGQGPWGVVTWPAASGSLSAAPAP